MDITFCTRFDLLIAEESIQHRTFPEDPPNLRTYPIRQGEHETMKPNGQTLITVGTCVGCFHCSVNCFCTAIIMPYVRGDQQVKVPLILAILVCLVLAGDF